MKKKADIVIYGNLLATKSIGGGGVKYIYTIM